MDDRISSKPVYAATDHAGWLFYGIAFIAGSAGLLYEILWKRYLLLLLGSTTFAVAGILVSYIGGLAIGSLISIRIRHRTRRPLLLFVYLQLVVGGYAVLSAIGFPYLTQFLADTAASSRLATTIIQFAGYLSLLIPTIAMGVAFPLLVYSREKTKGQVSAKAPGLFYGWDTAGAVAGALVTGFLLIPVIGMREAMLFGTILSLLAAALALGMHWRFNIVAQNKFPVFRIPISIFGNRKLKQLFLILVLSGLASLGYELIWTRILILIIGSSTYAFTITVSAFILGTALGSLLMSNKLSHLRSIYEVFVHTQIGVGIMVYITLLFYGKLPEMFMSLMNGYNHLLMDYMVQFILAGLIMIPPTLLIGASFPLAVALIEEHGVPQDHSFALSFGSISVGNVLGVILTALFIIPNWGLQKGTVILMGVNGLVAIFLTITISSIRGRKIIIGGVVGLFLIGLLLMPGWNRVTMTSGVYAKLPVYKKLAGSESNFKNLIKLYRLKYYKESIEDVVSVVQMPTLSKYPYYALAVDGKVDASTGTEDMKTQTLSGHLPFIFGRNIEKVLVIGLASGITSAAVALHPVSHVTTVEIEPAMKQAARVFKNFNNNVLNNKRVKVVIDDGRHYLNINAASWDLVVSEPSNPWMSGPSRLFTFEFYKLVKKRLNTDGLFVQWVPLYGMGTSYFKSIIHTFLSVFPHAAAFQVSKGDMLLIGSIKVLKISASRLNWLFENKKIRNSLERADIHNPGEILVRWLGSASILKTISKNAQLNTDNNGYVEFGSPRFLYRNTISKNEELFQEDTLIPRNLFRHIVWNLKDRSSQNDMLFNFAQVALKQNHEKVATMVKQYFEQEGNKLYKQYLSAIQANHKGDIGLAARHFENVIAMDPNFKEACWKLIRLYVSNGRLHQATQVLTRIRPFCSHNRFAYWQGVIDLAHKHPGKAANHFSSISTTELPEYKIDFPLYAYIAFDQIGDSLNAREYRTLLEKSLATLRQKAEQDESLQQIHELLNTVKRAETRWLPVSQSQKIDNILVTELLLPLQYYNHGINAMLTGRFQEARKSFQKVKAILSPGHHLTRATYFMALLDSIKEAN